MSSIFSALVLLPLISITHRSFISNLITFSLLFAKPLISAMENYLEPIINLGKETRVVRVKDIAMSLTKGPNFISQ